MRRNSWWITVLVAAFSFNVSTIASAQQLKPYFLVIVDTSGSMEWCAGGATNAIPAGSNDCSCHSGNNCSNGYTTNRCGFPSNKIGDAKCALQRILDGTGGDATFGLMQFEHPCDNACNVTGGQCTGQQNMCGANCDDAQLAVEISSGNATLMREWVDGVCQGTCGTNDFRHELTTGQWTPLAKSLQRANEYLRGQSATIGGWPYVTGGAAPRSPIANDPLLACRPVSVILLTDGDDTCVAANMAGTAAPSAAGALNSGDVNAGMLGNKAFRTYVIGFGASGGNFSPATLNSIATMGGTDSHDASGAKYFPAMNEEQLSIALNRIIADAQPPVETCNGADEDCDGNIDEGLPKFCDKPHGINDPTLCDEPNETKCDGMDDDCDGVIDEGLTNACGSCGDVPKETCDNIDNDCDMRIDEDATTNASCGNDKGECKAGKLVCTGGVEQCEGEIDGSPEICDCKDNDCDGATDEEGADKLCPTGQKCAGCRCVEFCQSTTEFSAHCPTGLTPEFQSNGECLCIVDNCNYSMCSKSTIQHGDDVDCAPDNPRVSTCTCKAGACVSSCTNVTCDSGNVCNPRTGRCVEDNCRGLGCTAGELCDAGTGRCEKDACANNKCEADQVCRGGACEASCATTRCPAGQVCKAGQCEDNKCIATCGTGKICEPSSGDCMADPCFTTACMTGQVCSTSTGKCIAEPCWNVKCPHDQVCMQGDCAIAGTTPGGPTDEAPAKEASRLLATGGGGCACDVPGGTTPRSSSPRTGWLLLSALLAATWLRRRRLQRRAALHALACSALALMPSMLSGCKVSPICIDCVDAALTAADSGDFMNAPDASEPTSSSDSGKKDAEAADTGSGTDAQGDGSVPDGGPKCTPTGPETCNNKDDDCDFKVDEEVIPRENTCNQTGVCAGTLPVCTNGKFVCRFASNYEADETLCDGKDNDCDGKVDESFPMLGAACEAGTGACRATGKYLCSTSGQGLNCDAKPTDPSDEVCNGKDDDCDGMVDEPKGNPGTNPSYVKDDVVQVRSDLWVYKYEASRVDADATKAGIVSTRTCSRAGVLPWTNVTYTEALAACESVNMTLCDLNDWVFACQSGMNCKWASSSCNTYTEDTCNGHDVNTEAGQPDTDALKATGSKSGCYADFGSGGRVFDLSGNAKEWTKGSQSPDANPLRGGSYNNNAEGLRCDFDFTLGQTDVRLPNVGFRCCSSTQP